MADLNEFDETTVGDHGTFFSSHRPKVHTHQFVVKEPVPRMSKIDYTKVNQYWEKAIPSILGPYMMNDFGFPTSAGDFRFQEESKIVQRLTREVKQDGSILDLGSGIGVWAEDFARRFSIVTAVESSLGLFQSLQRRCAPYPNLRPIHGDVMKFEPDGRYDLVFLGGLLMYLNEIDAIALLRKLLPCIKPGGMILCRETTVRGDAVALIGDYQVIYRSVSDYRNIFRKCGLSVRHVERNEPYVLLEMGIQLIAKWKQLVPAKFQALQTVGHLTYFGLRMGNPWIRRIPKALNIAFPMLENHFFVLGEDAS
jgi:SAM-dependent methyltransferase